MVEDIRWDHHFSLSLSPHGQGAKAKAERKWLCCWGAPIYPLLHAFNSHYHMLYTGVGLTHLVYPSVDIQVYLHMLRWDRWARHAAQLPATALCVLMARYRQWAENHIFLPFLKDVPWYPAKQVISRVICPALLNGRGLWGCQLWAVSPLCILSGKSTLTFRNHGWDRLGNNEARGQSYIVRDAFFTQRALLHLAKKNLMEDLIKTNYS